MKYRLWYDAAHVAYLNRIKYHFRCCQLAQPIELLIHLYGCDDDDDAVHLNRVRGKQKYNYFVLSFDDIIVIIWISIFYMF